MKRRAVLYVALALVMVLGAAAGVRAWWHTPNTLAAIRLPQGDSNSPPDPHLQVFFDTLFAVRTRYVDEPNMAKALEGSLRGMVESLDSNSSYLDAAHYQRYKQQGEGGSAGIGAYVSKKFGYAAVIAVLPKGPADAAGLETGDIIESLNGESTHEMALAEIRRKLAGAAGAKVELSIIRARKITPEKITLTLAEVAAPPVQQQMLAGNVGYISSRTLSKGRAQEIGAAVKALQAQGAKGFVLDLRDTAWGEPAEGAAVANLFLDHGRIAYLAGQKYQQVNYDADPQKAVSKLPLVVLVGRGTAGAAEVTAAGILDNSRGDVVGEPTFGDASVQKLFESPDGQAALILSIAKYYRPNGKAIQEGGVTPSVKAALDLPFVQDSTITPAEQAAIKAKAREQQLELAVEVLQKKLGGGK